jgi:mono/diheme cytochrome c family protein
MLTIVLGASLALAACGGKKEGGGGGGGGGVKMEGDVAGAREIFKQRCVLCHGDHGAGDGPGAANLNPKPRAFGDKEWQKSVTDDHIEKIIKEGGAAVGKSPLMPPNPDLVDKPEIVKGLRSIVREFGAK